MREITFAVWLAPDESSMKARQHAFATYRHLARAIVLVSCATFAAASASANVVEVTVGWAPAAQSSITGYKIHVGSTSDVFDQHIDVGMPNLVGGVLSSTLSLEDSQNNFISISAYDDMAVMTPYSDALLVLAAVPDEPMTSEEMSIEAATLGVMGVATEEDSSGSFDALPQEFKSFKNIKNQISYGTEYTICDLEGDGVVDLVLTNLLSNANSKRMRRESGRILIRNRRPNGSGGISERTIKVRADFLDGYARVIENHVSCGDIDGDGYQELIVSSGSGGDNQLQILDDITTGFKYFALPGSAKGVMQVALDILGAGGNGELHTASGDFDNDGLDEIVITFKRPLADQVLILDDANQNLAPMQNSGLDSGYLTAAEDAQLANFDENVVPVAIDFDEDGIDEIVIVHSNDSGLTIQMFDDAATNFVLVP